MEDKKSGNADILATELSKAYEEEVISEKTRKFEVSEATSFLSRIYERVRNTIDYKDEHLIRRFAIYRFLRVYLSSRSDPDDFTELLLKDLIRGKYIEDSQITDTKFKNISKSLEKYIFSKKLLNELRISLDQSNLWEFLLGVASTEIEKLIDPLFRPEIFVKLLMQYILRTLRDSNFDLSPEQESLQVFLACHKSLVKSDLAILRYQALTLLHPDFFNTPSNETIRSFVEGLPSTGKYVDEIIKSRTQEILYLQIRKVSPPFKVLEGMLESEPSKADYILNDENQLRIKSEEFINSYYADLKRKLNVRITRMLGYLFITKMLLAILIEAPVDLFFLKHINYTTLAINTIFPITLFYLIAKRIRLPGRDNNERIFHVIKSVVQEDKMFLSQQDEKLFTKRLVNKQAGKSWVGYVYALLYLLVYGFLFSFLSKIGFNFTSIAIFIFFVSVLSFFAWNIRSKCNDLQVISKKDSFIESILNIIGLPILKVGQRLSVEVVRFNFFTVFFDVILEAPFKIIVQSFEDVIDFLKSKHEEVIQS